MRSPLFSVNTIVGYDVKHSSKHIRKHTIQPSDTYLEMHPVHLKRINDPHSSQTKANKTIFLVEDDKSIAIGQMLILFIKK